MRLPKVFTEPFSDQSQKSLAAEAAKLFRLHQLPTDLEQWKKHRERLRALVIKHSGMGEVDHKLPLNTQITGTIQCNGYKVQKLIYQSRKDFYVSANLYIPDAKKPVPGVLGLHGHWPQGKTAAAVQARGHTLALNGYVALQIDAFGAGERSSSHGEFEYHGANLGGSLMAVGGSLMGMQIYDCIRGIDLLCSLDCVDAEKIGVTGASGGGNQTMWAAAMDERVTAAVPVACVGTFEAYINNSNCVCESLPNGLTFTEESAILALMAPKALKICCCLNDLIKAFYPVEMLRSYAEARKIFRLYGADSKFSYQIFNQPHGYWPEIRESMLGWFDLHLKGEGDGTAKPEKAFKALPEDEMLVFDKGKRPEGLMSIAQYCRKEAGRLQDELSGQAVISREEKRAELADVLKISATQKIKNIHDYGVEGDWHKFVLETIGDAKLLPLLLRHGSDKLRILSHPLSKEHLEDSEMLRAAIAGGESIIVADLSATGEIGENKAKDFGYYHDISRSMNWLGKTMIGEWAGDMLLVADFARQRFPQHSLSLCGTCETALAAVFASVFGEFDKVYAYDMPLSFAFNQVAPKCTMAIILQNIINFGDVAMAVVLSDAEIIIKNPVKIDGELLGDNESAAFNKQIQEIKNKLK